MLIKTAKDNSVVVLVEPTPEERHEGAKPYTIEFSANPARVSNALGSALLSSHPDLVEFEGTLSELPNDNDDTNEDEPEQHRLRCEEHDKTYKTESALKGHITKVHT